jgi:hypothetical protein
MRIKDCKDCNNIKKCWNFMKKSWLTSTGEIIRINKEIFRGIKQADTVFKEDILT